MERVVMRGKTRVIATNSIVAISRNKLNTLSHSPHQRPLSLYTEVLLSIQRYCSLLPTLFTTDNHLSTHTAQDNTHGQGMIGIHSEIVLRVIFVFGKVAIVENCGKSCSLVNSVLLTCGQHFNKHCIPIIPHSMS